MVNDGRVYLSAVGLSALTYAAVTLRIEMPLLMIFLGMSAIRALDVVGWLCWLPNLFVVETVMGRTRLPRRVSS